MYIVRDKVTGKARTWRVSYDEAKAIAAPCLFSKVVPDNGGQRLYPNWRPRFAAGRHPYDQQAIDALQAELAELIAAYKAGWNAPAEETS
jgi:hypothetical protein